MLFLNHISFITFKNAGKTRKLLTQVILPEMNIEIKPTLSPFHPLFSLLANQYNQKFSQI